MGKSSLKLDRRFVGKDGTCAVRIFVGYGTKLFLSTGVSVKEGEWNARTQMCVGKNAKILNSILGGMLTRVTARILELKDKGMFGRITKEQLKAMLTDMSLPEPPEEAKPTLGAMFRRVINIKGERNKLLFEATLKKLSAYCDPNKVKFDDINKMWLAGFSASMSGLSVNTKAIHLRNLRNVTNYALDEGITNNYPFRRFRIQTEETAMRVLPVATLRYYANATHLNKQYREYRDMFLLSFYLIGINICDLSKLTPESIVNGRLEYRRSKTGKLYSIRIEPEAQSIIDRYKGKYYLLSCFDRYQNYRDYAQHLNNGIRKIGPPVVDSDGKPVLTGNNYVKMNPLEPKASTYWARYSWATYASELDIPKDTISEALGHEYGSRITGVYIRFNRNKIDKANRMVMDYVLYGNK